MAGSQNYWPLFGGVPTDPTTVLWDEKKNCYYKMYPVQLGMCQSDIDYEYIDQDGAASGFPQYQENRK